MRKELVIKFHPTKYKFEYGQCALKAISQAFDLDELAVAIISKILKIEPWNGLDFWESTKIINTIGKHLDVKTEYIPNVCKLEYGQMLVVLNTGRYIAMFDEHLSFVKNGEVFDDYFYDRSKKQRLRTLQRVPTGWWRIGNHS